MSVARKKTQNNRRTAKAARCLTGACEPLEHRRLLSAYGPIVSVGSFVPFPNGAGSRAAVTFDISGNLWGTTSTGGPTGYGTVFEIANGSSTVTTVASFNSANGANPYAGVTFDANGNLWGTTYNGGSGSVGTVFEILKGTSTITTVASFNTSNGAHPMASVTFDAGGNLFGTTYNGGSGSAGTIFEITKGTSAITTFVNVSTFGGAHPEAAVTFDANGNLWGTTFNGGTGSVGTVFKIPKGSSTVSSLFAPSTSTGENPAAAVSFDASGNAWGTFEYGAANYSSGSTGDGSIYQISNGSSTLTIAKQLTSATGTNPQGTVAFDTSGNLWVTTSNGASNNAGGVLEIIKTNGGLGGVNFNTSSGGDAQAGLTLDGSGNLWGTT